MKVTAWTVGVLSFVGAALAGLWFSTPRETRDELLFRFFYPGDESDEPGGTPEP